MHHSPFCSCGRSVHLGKGLMAKATSNWTLCIVLLLVIALVVVCLFAWKLV